MTKTTMRRFNEWGLHSPPGASPRRKIDGDGYYMPWHYIYYTCTEMRKFHAYHDMVPHGKVAAWVKWGMNGTRAMHS